MPARKYVPPNRTPIKRMGALGRVPSQDVPRDFYGNASAVGTPAITATLAKKENQDAQVINHPDHAAGIATPFADVAADPPSTPEFLKPPGR